MASYKKHGSGWQARVRKRGRSLAKTFDTKAMARSWATRMEAELDQELALNIPAVLGYTLGNGIDRYTRSAAAAGRTWGKSKTEACRRLKEEIGDWPLDRITSPALIQWAKDRPYAYTTTRGHLVTLSGVLRDIRADNKPVAAMAARDASKRIKEDLMPVGGHGGAQRVSDAQLADLEAVWGDSKMPFDLVLFAVESSLRIGEICRIRWDDLEGGHTITIRDRKDPRNKQGNHGRVALTEEAQAIIARQPRLTDRIFPYNSESLSATFIRYRKLTDHTFRFHDLRHEGISRLFKRGLSIVAVASISGHKDWKVLQSYNKAGAEVAHDELKASS